MKEIFKKLGKFILIASISVLLLVSVFGGIVYVWWQIEDNKIFYEEKFDRARWLAADTFLCQRGRMYDDVLKNYLHLGMPINDVIKLLGVPEYSRIYDDYFNKKTCLQYRLGSCNWIPIPSNLIICPDANNLIAEFYKAKDNDSGKTTEFKKIN